jgi:prevent-host-death family protein
MKTLTALDLRKKLGSVLDDVSMTGEEVIISRANKPLAVIISIDEYEEKIQKKHKEQKLVEVAANMDIWKKKHLKETKVDTVKAVREIREGR